ncbi:MAG: aminopeptidase [Planctomycetaceae bacterium]|nr:aminopeptidase [Planctomycetaceae bacterium]
MIFLAVWCLGIPTSAQDAIQKFDQADKFRQLEEILPTPNDYRTASGSPGHRYWQQQIDYVIDVEIDDVNQELIGSEQITYTNRSPDPLRYVWLQLDPNIREPHSDSRTTQTSSNMDRTSLDQIRNIFDRDDFDGGVKISRVADSETGDALNFTVVKTMMRIDLPRALENGESYRFDVDWRYAINNSKMVRGRTGYEFFEKDGNYIYEMAQWFPRACAYTDVTGWQHKQFLGRGEFTLDFGDYEVRITVPADHVVASTGVLQNPEQVLSEEQLSRLAESKGAQTPQFVITPEEALANEVEKSEDKKTWVFKAENVRDFAFATSRKFIWDAMGVDLQGKTVMAMSFYPNEGEPLWSQYSTHAVAHTLEVFSKFTFDYPYPVAISVNGPVGGMEYPMICFNGPRPEEDGTYSARTKYGLISVVIHEVGHNWFPMIVNSDERQWTWMDEGLTTFMQYLAEQEWEEKYPSRRGKPSNIVPYMTSANQVPIMTNSDSVLNLGSNAYAKPATALNILRETVMGRELFDFAFKEYSNRWRFKRPMPSDFFRTMEDASGVDLDWFWRGWFYSTDHVDLEIADVTVVEFDTKNDYIEKPKRAQKREDEGETLSQERNAELPKRTEKFPELNDFYNQYDEFNVTEDDKKAYSKYMERLSDKQKEMLSNLPNAYLVEFRNIGGVVMPLIVELEFQDGTKEVRRIPAEIWRRNNRVVSKMFITEKPVKQIVLDPRGETADSSVVNNFFPRRIETKSVELNSNFTDPRRGRRGRDNPMRRALKPKDKKAEDKKAEDKKAEDKKAEKKEEADSSPADGQ